MSELPTEETRVEEWRLKSNEDRIEHALVKGIDNYIVEDVNEARLQTELYPKALNIIEGPLMRGITNILLTSYPQNYKIFFYIFIKGRSNVT